MASSLPQRARAARLAVGLAALGASADRRLRGPGRDGHLQHPDHDARPDLISVTTPGSQSGSIAPTSASPRASGSPAAATATDFALGGYDGDESSWMTTSTRSHNFCIEVLFNGANGADSDDLVAYSFGQVAGGSGRGRRRRRRQPRRLDGAERVQHQQRDPRLHHRPDLILSDTRPAQNQIAYVFDQEVREGACPVGSGFTSFFFLDGQGDEFTNQGCSVTTLPGGSRDGSSWRSSPGRRRRHQRGDRRCRAGRGRVADHEGNVRTTSSRSRPREPTATPTTPTCSRRSWSPAATRTRCCSPTTGRSPPRTALALLRDLLGRTTAEGEATSGHRAEPGAGRLRRRSPTRPSTWSAAATWVVA